MKKSFQNHKSGRAKAGFFGRLILRLLLAAVIGAVTGKLALTASRQQEPSVGDRKPEHVARSRQSPRRLQMAAKSKEDPAGGKIVASDSPSPGSRAWLALIERLPTMGNRDFFKLVQQSAGGAILQNAVLGEWARRYPKEMFQTLYAAFPAEDDPRRAWSRLAVAEWMGRNPAEAIGVLDGIPRRIGRGGYDPHMSAIDAAKSSGDFAVALDLESRWPNQVWSGLTDGAFENWYAGHAQAALAKIAKIGNAGLRGSYIERIGRMAAGDGEEGILATASSFSELDKQAFLKGLAAGMAKDSPAEAVSFLSRNFQSSLMSGVAESAISEWAAQDPRAAILWSRANLRGKPRDNAVVGAIRQVAGRDQEFAADLVMEMDPGTARNESAASLMELRLREKDPELAGWLEAFPDDASKRAMLDKNWNMIVLNAPGLLQTLTASDDPKIASERRITEFAKKLNANQPEAFESWLRSLPERNRNIAAAAVR